MLCGFYKQSSVTFYSQIVLIQMKSLHIGNCVHTSHPLYLTIGRIILKITEANQDIPQIRNRSWTIHIIDKDVKNAFVLPVSSIL